MRMIEPAAEAEARLRRHLMLYAWFSPSFPVGGFAFSHGLEWAQECGAVRGLPELNGWIADLIEHGSLRQDAILLAAAWRAAGAGDGLALEEIVALAAALQPSRERFAEASVQGQAFLTIVEAAYPAPLATVTARHSVTLPVAVGMAGAAHGIALPDLLLGYLGGFVANLSSAAVRLGIVGQTDGQRALAAAHPAIAALAQAAVTLTLDDLGSAALRSDLFSMQHETQYSRLFRS